MSIVSKTLKLTKSDLYRVTKCWNKLVFRVGGKPGVYTNVAEHVQWIREMITDTSDGDQTSDDNVQNAPTEIKSDLISTEAEKGNSNNGAGLKCFASNGKFCKFPFKFRGKVRLKYEFIFAS